MIDEIKTERVVNPTLPRVARWEWMIVGIALGFAFALGVSELSVTSLWHDELVHTYVGKSIAETGVSQLPSGVPYRNGTTQNLIIAAMIKMFGLSEFSVRFPSVLFASVNVVLIFLLTRPLLGRNAAVVAAVALALSPWAVAWSREARFYTLQQTLYLTLLISFWQCLERDTRRAWITGGTVAFVAYVLAVLSSFHSILFLGGVGGYVILRALYAREWSSRWVAATAAITVVGLLTIALFPLLMNELDRGAIVDRGGLGGEIQDVHRAHPNYYMLWLRLNLSNGFYAMAVLGFGAMLANERRKGLYATLAFWVPIVILTFLIGYRRPRFMFFAYPLYVMAWSYAVVWITTWLVKREKPWYGWVAAVPVAAILVRLAISFAVLTGDSLAYAQGAHVTLARKHSQWRDPCTWVKENREPNTVIITTTFLPVLHYVGEVDDWYPTRAMWWEADESGKNNLETLEDLQAYMVENPRGYYIAEYWRFERNLGDVLEGEFDRDILWVRENMDRVEVASNEDVTVFSWGLDTP